MRKKALQFRTSADEIKFTRQVKIKASGGIRHYPFAKELIDAGRRPAGLQFKPADCGRRKAQPGLNNNRYEIHTDICFDL